MARRRQARGVLEGGVIHAQLPGPLVHALHKGLFAAGDLLCQGHGAVVGGDHADGLEHLVHRHLFVLLQPDLAAAHGAGVGGGGDHGVIAQLPAVNGLHGQQQRHDLGDTGGLPLGVFVLGEEDGARLLLHQQGRGRRDVHSLGAGRQRQYGAQQRDQSFHRDSPLAALLYPMRSGGHS